MNTKLTIVLLVALMSVSMAARIKQNSVNMLNAPNDRTPSTFSLHNMRSNVDRGFDSASFSESKAKAKTDYMVDYSQFLGRRTALGHSQFAMNDEGTDSTTHRESLDLFGLADSDADSDYDDSDDYDDVDAQEADEAEDADEEESAVIAALSSAALCAFALVL